MALFIIIKYETISPLLDVFQIFSDIRTKENLFSKLFFFPLVGLPIPSKYVWKTEKVVLNLVLHVSFFCFLCLIPVTFCLPF